jgi:hypothetical protein
MCVYPYSSTDNILQYGGFLMDDVVSVLTGNGKRRTGIERRQFAYAKCIPERRSGNERRYPAKSCAAQKPSQKNPLAA